MQASKQTRTGWSAVDATKEAEPEHGVAPEAPGAAPEAPGFGPDIMREAPIDMRGVESLLPRMETPGGKAEVAGEATPMVRDEALGTDAPVAEVLR